MAWPSKTTTQSVTFDKSAWTVASAKKWLREHGFEAPPVDETKSEYRFRQRDPKLCQKEHYATIRATPTINIVICRPRHTPRRNPARRRPKHPHSRQKKLGLPEQSFRLVHPPSPERPEPRDDLPPPPDPRQRRLFGSPRRNPRGGISRSQRVMLAIMVNAHDERGPGTPAHFGNPDEKRTVNGLIKRGYAELVRKERSPVGRGFDLWVAVTPEGLSAYRSATGEAAPRRNPHRGRKREKIVVGGHYYPTGPYRMEGFGYEVKEIENDTVIAEESLSGGRVTRMVRYPKRDMEIHFRRAPKHLVHTEAKAARKERRGPRRNPRRPTEAEGSVVYEDGPRRTFGPRRNPIIPKRAIAEAADVASEWAGRKGKEIAAAFTGKAAKAAGRGALKAAKAAGRGAGKLVRGAARGTRKGALAARAGLQYAKFNVGDEAAGTGPYEYESPWFVWKVYGDGSVDARGSEGTTEHILPQDFVYLCKLERRRRPREEEGRFPPPRGRRRRHA